MTKFLKYCRTSTVYKTTLAGLFNFFHFDDWAAENNAKIGSGPHKFFWGKNLFNSGHPANRVLTPQYIDDPELCRTPHHLDWLEESLIGDLPPDVQERVATEATFAMHAFAN